MLTYQTIHIRQVFHSWYKSYVRSSFSQGWRRSIYKINYKGENGGDRRWRGKFIDSTPHRTMIKESAKYIWIILCWQLQSCLYMTCDNIKQASPIVIDWSIAKVAWFTRSETVFGGKSHRTSKKKNSHKKTFLWDWHKTWILNENELKWNRGLLMI